MTAKFTQKLLTLMALSIGLNTFAQTNEIIDTETLALLHMDLTPVFGILERSAPQSKIL